MSHTFESLCCTGRTATFKIAPYSGGSRGLFFARPNCAVQGP